MTTSVAVFTSIASNYLPKARVLAESVKRSYPEAMFYLMLVDESPSDFDLTGEPFDALIKLADLGIDNVMGWCFGHRIVELCTAVKGPAAVYLLETCRAEKVFYFDPDMVVFGRLKELVDSLEQTSILLTPHQSMPEETVDAIMDNEIASLKHGVFNLGFLGINQNQEGLRFAHWWSDRLLNFCKDEIENGLFTDQKWANLIPCFFENYTVVRSPAFNVATWNLSTRKVSGSLADGITVNGEPIGFYHFSGFDSGDQEVMLKKYAAGSSILFEMREWYISECNRNGQSSVGEQPYQYATYEDGESITQEQRALYRARIDLKSAFPNPFEREPHGGYLGWYKANVARTKNLSAEIKLSDDLPTSVAIEELMHWFEHRATQYPLGVKRIGLNFVASILSLALRLA